MEEFSLIVRCLRHILHHAQLSELARTSDLMLLRLALRITKFGHDTHP